MILKDNAEIERLVQYLDSKVVLLRTKYPNTQSLPYIQRFYNEVIIPWMEEFHLLNK